MDELQKCERPFLIFTKSFLQLCRRHISDINICKQEERKKMSIKYGM